MRQLAVLALVGLSVVFEIATGQSLAFREDFSSYEEGREASSAWETVSGEWLVKDGKYTIKEEEGINAISYAFNFPDIDMGIIEAKMTVTERLANGGWAFCGLILFYEPSNFWMLTFTEGPSKERYIDFLECYQGRWQAQNEGETKLKASLEENIGWQWEYHKEYKLRLELDKDGIAGSIIDAANNQVLAKRRWEFGDAVAIRMGKPGFIARGMSVWFDDLVLTGIEKREEEAMKIKIEEGKEGRIAILKDNLPSLDLSIVDHLTKTLRAAGFGVTYLSADDVCAPEILHPDNFFLYIIPNAKVYPAPALEALKRYLRNKGNLMVLGGPAFEDLVWKHQDKWINKELFLEMLAKIKPENVFLDFEKGVSDWLLATNDRNSGGTLKVVSGGIKGKCLKYEVSNLTGWTTFYSPVIENMFPSGHTLLCFWAKGDAKTPYMSIEMNEADGSRWISVVTLTNKWKYYVLPPEDFRYWPDSPTRDTRGGPGDYFKPEKAAKINFGLAFSFTNVGGGAHSFWVDEVGTARNPFGKFDPGKPPPLPTFETLSPTYKVYPVTNISSIQVEHNQAIINKSRALPTPKEGISPVRRPKGAGFGNQRKWRWIPLLNALDKNKEERGTVAWMLINYSSPYKGVILSSFGVNGHNLFKEAGFSSVLAEVARRIKEGVFLFEAGSQYFSYYPNEKVKLGAQVINMGEKDAEVTVRIQVTPVGALNLTPLQSQQPVFKNEATVSVKSKGSQEVEFTWSPDKFDSDLYLVRTELLKDGKIIDVISHELGILSDKKPSPDEFVTVKGTDFYLKGEKWYPVGINFWPLYVSGSEPSDYGLGWLDPGYYDPEEIERDLVRMNKLGMNMVSIQMGGKKSIRNLLDFLRRCERHNIKVNGFLNGASPIDFNENLVAEFIKSANLVNNPTLFAYDIIWEPGNWMFNANMRKRWDKDWEEWITERYSSLQNAEKDWGFPVPREEGKIASPSDEQISKDGAWRVMVAAYRRFMDDLMSKKWNEATRRLKAIDPNHLVSFRQGNTLPQDFTFTATPKHIDFICPEGYTIQNNEDGYNAAGFITRYVNFTTRGKPILWAEFGMSVWDNEKMQPIPERIKSQAEYHQLFYRMVLEAGANGTAPWWWPGGYRVDERSDFGIINPEGTFRPSAELIRKYSPLIKAPRSFPEPNYWITIDRDAHPGGYWHITFNLGKEEYKRARAMGKNLGIKTEGTGTNSANVPLVAVGNTKYNGHNPPKYLNAEFNWVKIKNASGQWVEVKNGDAIEVLKDSPVLATASVGNLQEAEWLTPEATGGKPGAVYLASTEESELQFQKPIPKNTPYLADAEFGEFILTEGISKETKVVLQMTAEGRARFGERLKVILLPK